MVEGVIFDMDGLMFDSEPMWRASWPPAFERVGLEMIAEVPELVPGMSKAGTADFLTELYGGDPRAAQTVEAYYEIAADTFARLGAPKKMGLDELLERLAELGIPSAVASSTNRSIVEGNLRHAGLEGVFPVVVAGDMGLASKPAPDIFLEAARQLGTEPAKTLVLEDSENGIRAAVAGGFIPVFVPDISHVSSDVRAQAAYICDSLLEVRDIL